MLSENDESVPVDIIDKLGDIRTEVSSQIELFMHGENPHTDWNYGPVYIREYETHEDAINDTNPIREWTHYILPGIEYYTLRFESPNVIATSTYYYRVIYPGWSPKLSPWKSEVCELTVNPYTTPSISFESLRTYPSQIAIGQYIGVFFYTQAQQKQDVHFIVPAVGGFLGTTIPAGHARTGLGTYSTDELGISDTGTFEIEGIIEGVGKKSAEFSVISEPVKKLLILVSPQYGNDLDDAITDYIAAIEKEGWIVSIRKITNDENDWRKIDEIIETQVPLPMAVLVIGEDMATPLRGGSGRIFYPACDPWSTLGLDTGYRISYALGIYSTIATSPKEICIALLYPDGLWATYQTKVNQLKRTINRFAHQRDHTSYGNNINFYVDPDVTDVERWKDCFSRLGNLTVYQDADQETVDGCLSGYYKALCASGHADMYEVCTIGYVDDTFKWDSFKAYKHARNAKTPLICVQGCYIYAWQSFEGSINGDTAGRPEGDSWFGHQILDNDDLHVIIFGPSVIAGKTIAETYRDTVIYGDPTFKFPPLETHDTELTIDIWDADGNSITEAYVGDTVYVVGTLRDAETNELLQNAEIHLYKDGTNTGLSDKTGERGEYSIPYTIVKADYPSVMFKTRFEGAEGE